MGNDEREQTLNQLLTELDGFESEKDAGPVICIAATNRPDVRSAFLPPEALCDIVALNMTWLGGRACRLLTLHSWIAARLRSAVL